MLAAPEPADRPPLAEPMTWAAICTTYPDQLVGITDIDPTRSLIFVSARVEGEMAAVGNQLILGTGAATHAAQNLRLMLGVLAMVLVVALTGCRREKARSAQVDEDERMVLVFEQMAELARERPTCARWADEQGRRFGAEALTTMTARMRTIEGPARERFQARFGERVQVAAAVVLPFSQRCLEELRAAAVPSIAVRPPSAPPCPALRVTLASARFDRAAVTETLRAQAQQCLGRVALSVADDVVYADVIAVMDVAQQHGFEDIAIETPGAAVALDSVPGLPPDRMTQAQLDGVLLTKVTLTEVKIGTTAIALDALDLDAQVAAAFSAALAAGATPWTTILQADRDSSGRTVKAVIAGARRAGYGNVLFAVKKR